MEQRRFLLFLALSMTILMVWSGYVMPRFFPPPKPVPPAEANAPDDPPEEAPWDGVAVAEVPGQKVARNADPDNADPDAPKRAERPAPAGVLPKHPHNHDVTIGSLDPESGYFLEVKLTTEGAAIGAVRLNDPRYRELDQPAEQLRLLGEVSQPPLAAIDPAQPTAHRTFQTSIDAIDRQLKEFRTSLNVLDWEIDPNDHTPSSVTFQIVSPDGLLKVVKRYSVAKIAVPAGANPRLVRDTTPQGYEIRLELSVRNLGDEAERVSYVLQGPTAVRLENVENTRKFRDLRMGFLNADGSLTTSVRTAKQVAGEQEDGKPEEWTTPVRFIGVDNQYFAALVTPDGDQLKQSAVAVARPQALSIPRDHNFSEISVALESPELKVGPGQAASQVWTLYAGPKREELLAAFGAESILDFGFASAIARGMLWLLKFFHDRLAMPWALAIICLTVVVRGCMFPISRKQALGAKKMKELQPKIAELKKKHGDDREKLARAQMELFSQHGYNPLAGCLPVFLQLPIFIGLYNALNNAVDLRMASFLWIRNLAAPDALFRFPFSIPFLGHDFNLLPIITVALFVVQQKMMMPPPTDEQQAMQYKMMNVMTIVMGFMFYTVPAGLCVYFIASSLWGMAERQILNRTSGTAAAPPAGGDADRGDRGGGGPNDDPPRPPRENFWTKLLEKADAAASQSGVSTPAAVSDDRRGNGRSKKDPRKGKSRR